MTSPPPLRALALMLGILAFPASAKSNANAATSSPLRDIDQRLMNAWAIGDPSPWKEYLDDTAIYVDEDGKVVTKSELLTHLSPLPAGYSTKFTVTEHRTVQRGQFAVTTHLDLEDLAIFGQKLEPRLRATESWHLTRSGWRIMSVQVLALPSDPAVAQLPEQLLDEYAGKYLLAPGKLLTLTRDGETLKMGPSGVTLFSEARDVFFIKGRPRERKVFLRRADGSITGFADRREGHELIWRRVP